MLKIQYEKFLSILAGFGLIGLLVAPLSTVMADPPTLEKMVFVDYAEPIHHGKSGDACGDGKGRYTTFNGGLRWMSFPITYQISAPSGAAAAAVRDAFAEWDAEDHPSGNLFTEVASGADIKVFWASIDGPGNVLAQTTFWYNPFTKEISRSEIKFDSGDSWFVASSESCTQTGNAFDIMNVAVHEIGHSIGLGHVSDRLLTMYGYASPGETQKRSLGFGDQRGLDKLY